MKIRINQDSVTIEGYVNAIERNSKPLNSRLGQFVERICAGAFKRALKRNDDVRILLNHDWDKDLGGTRDGNLELEEDNIGLHARATITDPDVIEDARRGNLVGWSFGFDDTPDGVIETRDEDTGLPLRRVKDLELYEVSLLNRSKTPAYAGTLVNVRAEDDKHILVGSDFEPDNIETLDESTQEALSEIRSEIREESQEENKEPDAEPATTEVSSDYYARYKSQIDELKKLVKN